MQTSQIYYYGDALPNRVKSLANRVDIGNVLGYYNSIMARVMGELYSTMYGQSFILRDMKEAGCSALHERITSIEAGRRHLIEPGLRRIAIGPIHKDYRRFRV